MSDYYFDMPNGSEIKSFPEFLQYVNNSLVKHSLGPVALLGVFVISFFYMKRYPTPQALASSLFTTMISSYMLYVINLLAIEYVYGTTILFAAAGFVLFFSSNNQRQSTV